MKLFPYHDATGARYPELDHREVTACVLAAYLDVSRETIWKRANAGAFGRTRAEGAELRRGTGSKSHWVFRPSVIWRVRQWGRYTQVGFRAQDLEGRVRIYHCDPVDTAKREQSTPTVPADVQDLMRQLAGCNLNLSALMRRLALPTNEPLTFPQESAR